MAQRKPRDVEAPQSRAGVALANVLLPHRKHLTVGNAQDVVAQQSGQMHACCFGLGLLGEAGVGDLERGLIGKDREHPQVFFGEDAGGDAGGAADA